MRGLAVAVGSLLLVGGAVLVVVADQERQASLDAVRLQLTQTEERLAETRERNLDLAGALTSLRTRIAEQDAAIADATGFLP